METQVAENYTTLAEVRAAMLREGDQDSQHPLYLAEVARLNDEARKRLPGSQTVDVFDMCEGRAKIYTRFSKT